MILDRLVLKNFKRFRDEEDPLQRRNYRILGNNGDRQVKPRAGNFLCAVWCAGYRDCC